MAASTIRLSPAIRTGTESLQQMHYERIAVDYDAHYNDVHSQEYMRRFVFEPMFEGLGLKGAKVLEAMCGGGQATRFLLDHKAIVTGLDISPQQSDHYKRRHPGASVFCGSILNSGIEANSMDVVAVVGGIHHMPPYEIESIEEIHRILKPGGSFCFMEPHSESIAETFRKTWYKVDPLFAENEAAVNMTQLRREFAGRFEFKRERYLGNVGYLFVLNSMVFRLPVSLKAKYSGTVLAAEGILNKVLGKPFSCFVAGQWQKK